MSVSGLSERRDWAVIDPSDPVANPDAVREQMVRLLSNPLFHNSKRYSDLLTYIVDRTLDGQHECLKERIIGIEVFGRSPDYDTTVDSIVRGAAGEVRKRLARHYQDPVHRHELRIELPTRSYIAEFRHPTPNEVSVPHATTEDTLAPALSPLLQLHALGAHPPLPARRFSPLAYLLIALTVVILCSGAWQARRMLTPAPVIDRLWLPVLNNPDKVSISIGSPSHDLALGSTPTATGPTTLLSDVIRRQVSFPLSEMNAGGDMTAFLTRHGKESVIRLSESTTLSDLHGSPLVIIGSYPNQWAVRLGSALPFQFHSEGSVHWIEDTSHPTDRRWIVDLHSPVEQVTSEYSLITRGYDQSTEQWWIGVGGLTVLGTLAAEHMVIDPRIMQGFGAQFPKGWEHKNLQIVVQTNMVNGSLGAAKVVAARTW